jgi:hypothetical protein
VTQQMAITIDNFQHQPKKNLFQATRVISSPHLPIWNARYDIQVYAYNNSTFSLGSMSATNSLTASEYTTSTSSTVPGLGELSGRAILALGKVTLRGTEYVIIRRRLEAISAKFPHLNIDQIPGIREMYDDVLELSRFAHKHKIYTIVLNYPRGRHGLYADAIRGRAMAILLVQIGSGQTQQLVKHLLNWPFTELKIFISELAAILGPLQCVYISCAFARFFSEIWIGCFLQIAQESYLPECKNTSSPSLNGKATPWSLLSYFYGN